MSVADPKSLEYRSAPLASLGLDREKARVLIVGLGKTGYSIARFLAGHGIRFAVTDTREKPPNLAELRQEFPDAGVFLGGFQPAAFSAATHLVVSPGVALEEPQIRAAASRGIPVMGDLDLFAAVARAPVAAITGSNGKSTVTTLLGLMAEADGRKVQVGGNLGTPMLDLLDDDAEMYVLELSSFQLERSERLEPVAATVLNISPDHMDRYPDLAAYAAAKQRIFRGTGAMILNVDDPIVAAMAEAGREPLWFGVERVPAGSRDRQYWLEAVDGGDWLFAAGSAFMKAAEVRIQGRHNLANALAAVALGDVLGLSRNAMAEALRTFDGLDHRMQWVADIEGVAYVNDSKATNVGACMAALGGLDGKAVLIAGGDGKGADFTVLRQAVAEKVSALVLLGKDGPLLEAALSDLVPTARVENLTKAVAVARTLAKPGETVLLAPACASLDQFKDYQERGRVFAEAVRSLKK
jgi:UDP-N-acetylmuramoylalanine--D-glutamate ligase